jgi:hypothetical protein
LVLKGLNDTLVQCEHMAGITNCDDSGESGLVEKISFSLPKHFLILEWKCDSCICLVMFACGDGVNLILVISLS